MFAVKVIKIALSTSYSACVDDIRQMHLKTSLRLTNTLTVTFKIVELSQKYSLKCLCSLPTKMSAACFSFFGRFCLMSAVENKLASHLRSAVAQGQSLREEKSTTAIL